MDLHLFNINLIRPDILPYDVTEHVDLDLPWLLQFRCCFWRDNATWININIEVQPKITLKLKRRKHYNQDSWHSKKITRYI